jgi:hypothetical protein
MSPSSSHGSRARAETHRGDAEPPPAQARHRASELTLVPLAFLLFALIYPTGKVHWDVLERAYIVDYPGRFVTTHDGSPRDLFLHFAHVLELPLAAAFGKLVPGLHGVALLHAFEACVAAVLLWLFGSLVLFWRQRNGAGPGDRVAAIVAQLALATSLAFWKMAAGGEEKILALATQLGFLYCFWRCLFPPAIPEAAHGQSKTSAAAGPETAGGTSRRELRWATLAAAMLAVAVLSHLTGAVLIPFAALVLWLSRRHAPCKPLAIALALGATFAAVAYLAIAAITVHARTPTDYWNYFTFYHHGADNFFEPTGAAQNSGWRLSRVRTGLAFFFSGKSWDGILPLVLLAWWLTLHGMRGLGQAIRRWRARPQAPGGSSELLALGAQAALLALLWALHFAYFEPDQFESWTLVTVLALLAAAAQLPRDRRVWIGMVLPVFLVAVNVRHYRWNHRADVMAPLLRTVVRASRPNDLLILEGGRQDGVILRGSLWTRYFLAYERQRTVVSLFDVTGLTETEYWGRPFPSAEALQAAIDSGRRAFASNFMVQELKLLRLAGLLDVTWSARTDSVIEITHVKEIPFDPAAPSRVVVLPKDAPALEGSRRMALLPRRKPLALRPAGSADQE